MSTEPTQISAEGLAELKAELEHLETTARKEISQRIKTARDFGDLKENSEYHDAKNEQAMLERRIAVLTERLRNAEVVRAPRAAGEVAVGTTVEPKPTTSVCVSTSRTSAASSCSRMRRIFVSRCA